jgi:DHA3 family tetracycline resistance protein-like MFS transporter
MHTNKPPAGVPGDQPLLRLDAYKVYLFLETAMALIFAMIFTASMVYQINVARLSPLQLVLVGTTLELSVFLFEVPTGVVADVYSRRLSVIIGMALIGSGFILEGSFPIFWSILLAQLLWGIGYTFTSGATQAWITDEIGEAAANKAFLRSSQLSQISALLGIGAGMILGALRVNLPILVGGSALILLAVFLTLVMPETGFHPTPRQDRSTWQHMADTFRDGLGMVSRRPALYTILLIGFFYGLYSEGLDRLWTKHMLEGFAQPDWLQAQPVVFIGAIQAVGMLLSSAALGLLHRRVDTESHLATARSLLAITGVLISSVLAFALAPWLIVALIARWIISVTRAMIDPLYTAWVNQRLDSRVRATVLSMGGQVDAIGQVAGGPVVGAIGNALSVSAAITVSGVLLTPVLALYARTLRQESDTLMISEES